MDIPRLFTLVAYRPNSADYSMGCLMDTKESYCEVHEDLDEKKLSEYWADYLAENKTQESWVCEWEITVIPQAFSLHSGLDEVFSDEFWKARDERVNQRVAEEVARQKRVQEERKEVERARMESEERAQLERLKKKYESKPDPLGEALNSGDGTYRP